MIDIVLDIRKGSPTFGKALLYDMPTRPSDQCQEWIWVPPGFAHGNFFLEETMIEYFCSGEHSPNCEAGISPLTDDIDWSLCDRTLKQLFDDTASKTQLMTDKDRNGFTLKKWQMDSRSDNFTEQTCY
jgi:dTDP-4-dehydrorhamnose 3,5-epimerase-like enzyme